MTYYIGLMSGTSLDGVDGVLVACDPASPGLRMLAAASLPFDDDLRMQAMALQAPGDNELHREALLANLLAARYADCVHELLTLSECEASAVRAIGVHGQTIRHRPELGYTRQTNNPALLAELTGIDVIADFRSRDIAAGGQGAPLVPAFHHAVFAQPGESRVVANIGGISNISILDAQGATGFDTGPGNMLMDAWIARHQGQAYDANGAWAATGTVDAGLLAALRSDAFFHRAPPKSTGRDLFDLAWLDGHLAASGVVDAIAPADVQATLLALSAGTLADAIAQHAPQALAVYVCGGGAFNGGLLLALEAALKAAGHPALVTTTAALGVSPMHVEALAFAWLAERFDRRLAGNLPAVTGARGPRILGALYPAGVL
jgi:anhydro-N-acetylmuramic acid kinase